MKYSFIGNNSYIHNRTKKNVSRCALIKLNCWDMTRCKSTLIKTEVQPVTLHQMIKHLRLGLVIYSCCCVVQHQRKFATPHHAMSKYLRVWNLCGWYLHRFSSLCAWLFISLNMEEEKNKMSTTARCTKRDLITMNIRIDWINIFSRVIRTFHFKFHHWNWSLNRKEIVDFLI